MKRIRLPRRFLFKSCSFCSLTATKGFLSTLALEPCALLLACVPASFPQRNDPEAGLEGKKSCHEQQKRIAEDGLQQRPLLM